MSYGYPMNQVLSVSCKLQVTPKLKGQIDRTLGGFSDACNQILQVSKEQGVRNTTKLHHLTYHDVRNETGLKANHVCQAIRRVVTAVKTQKQVHKFRPTSLALDARTFSFREKDWSVGVTLMDGRQWMPLSIGNYQRGLLKGQKPTSATLTKKRNGSYYINIQVDIPTQPRGKTPRVLGVDLGRRDIAHLSDGQSWEGGTAAATRDKYFRVRSSIQRKRTKSSRRLLRRLSGKEARFRKNVNHTISKRIVETAKKTGSAIAMEDLTGIRQTAKVRKAQRREHHGWSFYQLRAFIDYKANIAGVPLVFVEPRYTSKTCARCHHIGTRNGKGFKCGHCGLHIDSDWNGSLNISSLGALVTAPEISKGLTCELEGQLSLLIA